MGFKSDQESVGLEGLGEAGVGYGRGFEIESLRRRIGYARH